MNRNISFSIGGDGAPTFDITGPERFAYEGASIGKVVGDTLNYVLVAAGIGLLLMIISSGFTLMMSAGDAKKAAAGKTTLTNAIVGFLLVFSAFWITQALGIVFGWDTYIGGVFGK